MQQSASLDKKTNLLINTVSIGIPIVVAILLSMPNKFYFGEWTKNIASCNWFDKFSNSNFFDWRVCFSLKKEKLIFTDIQ